MATLFKPVSQLHQPYNVYNTYANDNHFIGTLQWDSNRNTYYLSMDTAMKVYPYNLIDINQKISELNTKESC